MTQLENFIPIADSVHVMVLRIIGSLALIFGVIELGLGGGPFNYLSNQKYGAWWVGLMVTITEINAIIALNKGWVISTLAFSIATLIISVVGAALDGVTTLMGRKPTACASNDGTSAQIVNYGSSALDRWTR